jgi:hypothetical protein
MYLRCHGEKAHDLDALAAVYLLLLAVSWLRS